METKNTKSQATIRNELKLEDEEEINVKDICPETLVKELQKFWARGKTYGAPETDGSFLSNWMALIQVEHEVLAIFRGHALDPFTRNERLIFLFNSLAFLFVVAMLLKTVEIRLVYRSLITAILLSPYKMLLRILAECPCFYRGESQDCNECFRESIERIGGLILFLLVLISCAFIAIGLTLASTDGVIEWSISILISFLITSNGELWFHIYWNYEKDKEEFIEKWKRHFRDGYPPVSFTQVAWMTKKWHSLPTSSVLFPDSGVDYTENDNFDNWFGIHHLHTEDNQMTNV